VRRALFSRPRAAPDARPALLSVVALMLLLVPMVLLTSTGQKATGLALGLPGPGEDLPPLPPGPVERLRVTRTADGYRVDAGVRRTDVLATTGEVEAQQLDVQDLPALQAQLRRLKALDPDRQRITLSPAADTPAREVVALMDAVRADGTGPLFPQVIMESTP